MQALHRVADRLDEAAAVLAAAHPADLDPGAATTADNPGLLGEVTEALQRQRTAALHARAREATTTASRLAGLAADVRAAAAGYADVDESARSRTASGGER